MPRPDRASSPGSCCCLVYPEYGLLSTSTPRQRSNLLRQLRPSGTQPILPAQQIIPNRDHLPPSTLLQLQSPPHRPHLAERCWLQMIDRSPRPPRPTYRPSAKYPATTDSLTSSVRTNHPPSRRCGVRPSDFFTSSAVIKAPSRYGDHSFWPVADRRHGLFIAPHLAFLPRTWTTYN